MLVIINNMSIDPYRVIREVLCRNVGVKSVSIEWIRDILLLPICIGDLNIRRTRNSIGKRVLSGSGKKTPIPIWQAEIPGRINILATERLGELSSNRLDMVI
jgi:hypothetical protein